MRTVKEIAPHSKEDEIKIKRNASLLFPPQSYLPFLPCFFFSALGVILHTRLLGVVKSNAYG